MDDYIADINRALKELDAKRKSQDYQNSDSSTLSDFCFHVSDEIADAIRQRREESERMRHVSIGVYA